MYYCAVCFQIEKDNLVRCIIEDADAHGCIRKLAQFLRDVFSASTYYRRGYGMMESMLLAQKAGYRLYAAGTGGIKDYFEYTDDDSNERIGGLTRHYSDGRDDSLRLRLYDCGALIDEYRDHHFNAGDTTFDAWADTLEAAVCAE